MNGKEAQATSKSRSWMYTINNYTEEDENHLQSLECVYHVYGREVGEQGTPHLQGCITFKNSYRFNRVKGLINGHLTIPRDLEAARNYCMKDGDYFLHDEHVGHGKRTDLVELVEFIKAGNNLQDTAKAFGAEYVRYHNGIEKLICIYQYNTAPRSDKPIVSWYFGTTGSGKTRGVFESEPDLWIAYGGLNFFNGYNNQTAVLFDDFRGSFAKFRELLQLLDRYPITVSVKGSTRTWNPSRIYITSNQHPVECYDKEVEDLAQLVRRIDNIVHFTRRIDSDDNGDNGNINQFERLALRGVYAPGPDNPQCVEEVINLGLGSYIPNRNYAISPSFNVI